MYGFFCAHSYTYFMKKIYFILLLTLISAGLFAQNFISIPNNYSKLEYVLENGHFISISYSTKYYSDGKTATYDFCNGFTKTMSGTLQMTENEIYLSYPTEISKDTDEKAFIDKWLSYFFPNKETAILKWDESKLLLENNVLGAYVFKDASFSLKNKSKNLNSINSFKIDGYEVSYLSNDRFAEKETNLYEKPSTNSKTIPITKNPIFTNHYNKSIGEYNGKIVYEDKKISMNVIPGTGFSTRCVYKPSSDPETWWYYVLCSSLTEKKYGWIQNSALTPVLTTQLFENFITTLKKNGYIKIETVDISKLPSQMDCISIEPEEGLYLFLDDNFIWYIDEYTHRYTKIPRSALKIDTDGFMKLNYKNTSRLFILGGIQQIFYNFKNDGENKYEDPDREGGYHNYYFKSITASSSFQEKIKGNLIKYTPDNLTKAFEAGCRCHPYWWNYKHIPWVEGVEGNGIGEYITVEFKEPIKELELLNGYTDINNLKLYKENARIKQFKLEDLDNKTESIINFEDYVYFNKVVLEKPTTKIRLTIVDVYKGTKYQDTCFSSILAFPNQSEDPTKRAQRNAENFKSFYKNAMEVPFEFF